MATLSKTDLVTLIAERTGKPKTEAKFFLDAAMDCITDSLVKGDDVNLIGFANFKTKHVAERKGRNPATGADITIPARKSITIAAGKALKDAVNH